VIFLRNFARSAAKKKGKKIIAVGKKLKKSAGALCMIAAAIVALTLSFAAPVYAADGTLNFISSTPSSGGTNVPLENVGVKLFFDNNVTDYSVWASNATMFTLTDPDGNKVDYEAYPGQKIGEEGYILVLAKPIPAREGYPGQLLQDSIYTLTISGDLMAVSGARLGEDIRITFQTMDMAANTRLSMIVMVLMLVGVIGFMFVTNWRKMKAEAEAAALSKANPYRVAKDKNISVDDAKLLIEKARERNQKQLEKTGGKAPPLVEKTSVAPRLEMKKKEKKKTHKVKRARPVSEGGSKYKSGRKGEKSRKARAEAARKAAASNQRGPSGSRKSSKGKGKGKRR